MSLQILLGKHSVTMNELKCMNLLKVWTGEFHQWAGGRDCLVAEGHGADHGRPRPSAWGWGRPPPGWPPHSTTPESPDTPSLSPLLPLHAQANGPGYLKTINLGDSDIQHKIESLLNPHHSHPSDMSHIFWLWHHNSLVKETSTCRNLSSSKHKMCTLERWNSWKFVEKDRFICVLSFLENGSLKTFKGKVNIL